MADRNRGETSAPTRRLVVGACVLGVLLLLGASLGPLWWGLAPRAEGTALEVSPDYYRVKHQSLLEAGTGWSVTPTGGTEPYAPARSHAFPATAARLHRTKLREAEELYPAAAAPEDDPAGTEPRTRPGRTVARFLRR